jgi:perosamine synthetase
MTRRTIALHEPTFGDAEWKYVRECLETGWVSSGGPFVTRLEKDLARVCGTSEGVAIVNGTCALHLALLALGVAPGDLVICPTLTFIAPVNAVRYCGADPVFLDSERRTMGLDPAEVVRFLKRETKKGPKGECIHKASGRRIAACVVVHLFGHAVDLDPITAACKSHGVVLVEDASEGLGATYRGRPLGSIGRVGTLSFNGNKVMTTGGGGAVVTDDGELAARIRHLSTQAKKDDLRYVHDAVGFNYRMPNINAALGVAQLERLTENVERKRVIAQRYIDRFASEGIDVFVEQTWARSNYWLNTVFVGAESRDRVLHHIRSHGVASRPLFAAIHSQSMYADSPRGKTDVADSLIAECLSIPSSPSLSADDVDFVVETVMAGLNAGTTAGRSAK